jgi:uncharacterized cupredoxin-like copper-binding protein
MARTLLLADEINLPITTGTATSFTNATVVRLVNNSTSAALVTVVETQSGNGIGSMTMPPNSVEYLEKQPSYCVFASATTVKGAKVGFTA